MSHTPGPWSYGFGSFGIPSISAAVQGRRWHVASVTTKRIWPTSDGPEAENIDEEVKANARLIAAAPTMLEACKAARRFLKSDDVPRDPMVMRLLDEAIAKAEGKQP